MQSLNRPVTAPSGLIERVRTSTIYKQFIISALWYEGNWRINLALCGMWLGLLGLILRPANPLDLPMAIVRSLPTDYKVILQELVGVMTAIIYMMAVAASFTCICLLPPFAAVAMYASLFPFAMSKVEVDVMHAKITTERLGWLKWMMGMPGDAPLEAVAAVATAALQQKAK